MTMMSNDNDEQSQWRSMTMVTSMTMVSNDNNEINVNGEH